MAPGSRPSARDKGIKTQAAYTCLAHSQSEPKRGAMNSLQVFPVGSGSLIPELSAPVLRTCVGRKLELGVGPRDSLVDVSVPAMRAHARVIPVS